MVSSNRSKLGAWLGPITAALSALALGALWCLIELRFGYPLVWFALVCGIVIALILRSYGYAQSKWGAFFAAIFTALACFYAQCLLAICDVAQSLGIPLRETLPQIGLEFTLATARARTNSIAMAWFVVAMTLTALLMLKRRR
jgi:hypothetical protein